MNHYLQSSGVSESGRSGARRLAPADRPPRLCWTRHELVQATGLSYKTLVNLEQRGLLRRVPVGINVAVYSNASVRALFGDPAGSQGQGSVKGRHASLQQSAAVPPELEEL
jgi:hypothetical protein